MWIELVLFLWASAVIISVISFFSNSKGKEEILFLPILAAILFIGAGFSTFTVEKSYCESNIDKFINSTYIPGYEIKWTCNNSVQQNSGLAYLSFGLAAVMFIYTIIRFFTAAKDEINNLSGGV